MMSETYFTKRLFELQDLKYKDFQAALIPTISPEKVIGVRTPMLRALAKDLSAHKELTAFMNKLPHTYYEEDNLHAAFICQMKDYDQCVDALDKFLPYVDNWATCDMMSPPIFKKHLPQLIEQIKIWIADKQTYVIRFGLGMLMKYFLDDAFLPEYLELAAGVHSDEYYVNMMIAWFFATALAKQYASTLPLLETQCLNTFTHNRAIQKAVESLRITDAQKVYLRTLKVK